MHVCPDCGERYGGPGRCARDGATLEHAIDPLIGTQISSYRVTKLLGAGGMGRVYKGVQPSIGARVAIKVLTAEASDAALVERFFAEARAVNLIRHEQIVNVMDLNRLPDGRPYIVMEYLDGATLAGVLKERGTLPLGTMAQVASEVLDALAAAHARSIIHRDLKPDNIWITVAGHAKVLDFGIAKLDPGLGGSHQATKAGSIMGTPPYMSPEQAMSKAIDARADLYSMGIILYECVTGRVPFMAESLFEILRLHLEEPPPPMRPARPDLPPAMEAVILRALAKEPAQRWSDAVQMSQALLQATVGLPQEAWATLRGVAGGSSPTGGMVTPYGPRLGTAPTLPDPKAGGGGKKLGLIGAIAAAAGAGAAAVYFALHSSTPSAPPPPPPPEKKQPGSDEQLKVAQGLGVPPAPAAPDAAPPAPPPPEDKGPQPLSDGAHFDTIAYLPEAQRLARTALADAELTQIIVQDVHPDGSAELTLDGYPFAKYAFRSTTGSQRGDTPLGIELKCLVNVFATSYQGVHIEPRTDEKCDDKIIGWPHCSPKQIWDKALEGGAPENAVATLQWMTDFNGKTHWMFVIGSNYTKWYDDDCSSE